jgi:hypothetical protein
VISNWSSTLLAKAGTSELPDRIDRERFVRILIEPRLNQLVGHIFRLHSMENIRSDFSG